MYRKRLRTGMFITFLLLANLAHTSEFYTGLRGGILLTSPGNYTDIGSLGLIGGYQLSGCCWSAEAELYSSVGSSSWQGQGMALSAVYRASRIGSDSIIFSPKFKIGAVETRYTQSGNTQINNTINLGIGILIGDRSDVFEFEVSGSTNRLGGSDEVLYFSINYIKPL